MTSIENVYAIRDSNKAYAYLIDMALIMGDKFLYEKLKKERTWFCESLDRFYENNKTGQLKSK